jgi:hypothetical protein
VVALDANGSAVSNVAITDASGNYELQVSSERNPDGTPVGTITLRADADNFQNFPGIRPPFAIDLSQATGSNDSFVLDNSLTDIGMAELPMGAGDASIQGTVQLPKDHNSVLVVAELSNGDPCPALPNSDCTAIAGEDGNFTIFNLPAGSYDVKVFVQGSNYNSQPVTLSSGQVATVSQLTINNTNTGTLNAKVNIVNPGQGNATSVILVLESTLFEKESALLSGVPILIRGAMPPGLRAADVTGNFNISGIPAGRYVILAAFEDDFLVRDPDTCIAGTQIIHQTFAEGQDVTLSNPFKITGSLDVLSPTQNQVVSATPTLSWVDDSSEDLYQISVFDTFGNIVWDTTIPGSSGSNPSVVFNFDATATQPLESGKFYQFHVFSVKNASGQCANPHAISQTEDLLGVFQVQ